ncbi:MAG: hypothetical protein GC155_06385 [Alphaproteobacteria bacterium]|nr:hypothetical protein [Alphaproteobacteria bacterium]
MIRTLAAAAAIAALALGSAAVADTVKLSTTTSLLGDILDNPAARAAFTKIFPDIAANPALEQGRGMTLADIAGYVPDQITPEKLKELQAEFDKIEE